MRGLTAFNLKIVSEVLGSKAYPLAMLELLGDAPLLLDLGANIGSFSLACHALRPDARIIAMEPDPDNFCALKANVGSISTELHQAALAGQDGVLDLFLGEKDAVANSTFIGKMAPGQKRVEVRGFDARSFLEGVERRYGEIALLKSDIEGGEWHLLNVPDGALEKIPVIFIEYHSSDFLARFLGRLLASHVIYSGVVRFTHRGEIALLRKDLVPQDQSEYEIKG